ncbi:YCF48-related protein [Caldimonas sp. KR1-144]|uniref:YCF48-related protein n=1 Tax=Caldimonas sp. KR1-144 TaxID=3400911 RepID=UPI003C00CF38
MIRAAMLAGLALWVAAATAQPPAVLAEPALQTPRALGAAMLAVTRAGSRLVAVGERGIVLLSDDDGAHWRQAQVPVRSTLTAVRFVDARNGWAAGHLGVILKTADGGASWALQLDGMRAAERLAASLREAGNARLAQRMLEEGPDKPFFDLDFAPDGRSGFAVGAYNLAFATRDGGASWQPIATRLPNPKSLHLYGVRIVGGAVYVAGEQGLLLRSDDAGTAFRALEVPYKGSFFGLLAARSGTLIAYGLRGNAVRSSDQGAHWDKLALGAASLAAGGELPDGTLVLLAQTGERFESRDDGRSFERRAATESLPATGFAPASGTSTDLVLASLRGMTRLAAR